MTTEPMALDLKVAGFGTLLSYLVRAQNVRTSCSPTLGVLTNSPNEGRNIKVYAALKGDS